MKQHEAKIKKRAAIISLVIGLGMFVFKMGAYMITNSAAIFSDALESVVHIAATSMALFSIYLSLEPADDSHPYGHGNIEYFSAGLEGLLIIIAAAAIIYNAAHAFIVGIVLEELDLGFWIILFAGVVNFFLGFFLINTGKRTNSLTLVADGRHVLTDSITSLAVVVGLLLVLLTDYVILDPVVAILIAFNIIFTGYKLIRESVGGLMHETDTEMLNEIVVKIGSIKKNYWVDVHHLRFWKSGERIFIDMHLVLPFFFTIKQSHDEDSFLDSAIKEISKNAEIKIHLDYCLPDLCKYCSYKECSERSELKTKTLDWSASRLTGKPIVKIHEDD